jgi:hypothetical protein
MWAAPRNSPPRTLNREEARQLVFKALEEGGASKLPHFTIEDESADPNFPAFYNFSAVWYNPGGSFLIGYYDVDQTTGDVWSGTDCLELKSPSLRESQKLLRRQLGIDPRMYLKLRRPGPMCGVPVPDSPRS